MEVQKWCPNCRFFFKNYGMNDCRKVNWNFHPIGNSRVDIKYWLDENTDYPGGNILKEADNCPGFESFGDTGDTEYEA